MVMAELLVGFVERLLEGLYMLLMVVREEHTFQLVNLYLQQLLPLGRPIINSSLFVQLFAQILI